MLLLRLSQLGIHSSVISKIGNDDLGKSINEFLNQNNVDTSLVQIDKKLSTGIVNVLLDDNRNAKYDIVSPSSVGCY